jgi:unsaturated chondroitin disaccharide hydrolase
MVYSAQAALVRPDEPLWSQYAVRTADWWMANVPEDKVSFWDFDDPAIPNTSRDTAATAMATAALLRLSHVLQSMPGGDKYGEFARESAAALISGYLTPPGPGEDRPVGMLTGGCFTRRSTVRSLDAATDVELIFGSYFLFEALAMLLGDIPVGRI